jgi:hypothetical protein
MRRQRKLSSLVRGQLDGDESFSKTNGTEVFEWFRLCFGEFRSMGRSGRGTRRGF